VNDPSLDLMNAKTVRVLALDYGRSRIGLAIGNTEAGLAQPLGTLDRKAVQKAVPGAAHAGARRTQMGD